MTFFKYAVQINLGLKWHILGGGVFAALAHIWLAEPNAMLVVFIAAIVWEIGEFIMNLLVYEFEDYGNLAEKVSPRQHFFIDAFADVVFAMINAAIVLMI